MATPKDAGDPIACKDLPKGTIGYHWPLTVNGGEDWIDAVVRQNLQPTFDQINAALAGAYCSVGACDTGTCSPRITSETYTVVARLPNLIILHVQIEVTCACKRGLKV